MIKKQNNSYEKDFEMLMSIPEYVKVMLNIMYRRLVDTCSVIQANDDCPPVKCQECPLMMAIDDIGKQISFVENKIDVSSLEKK